MRESQVECTEPSKKIMPNLLYEVEVRCTEEKVHLAKGFYILSKILIERSVKLCVLWKNPLVLV